MTVKLINNGVAHRFLHVYQIIDTDNYIILEPFHDVIEHWINGSWNCNTEAVTVHKSKYEYMEITNS